MADIFQKYRQGSPSQYGWLPQLQLESDIRRSDREKGEWGSDYLGGSQMGGLLGGVAGQYGLPLLLGMTGGPAGLAVGALGSSLGGMLGSNIGGGMAAGERPESGLGAGGTQELLQKLQQANQMRALSSGTGVVTGGLEMGVDEYGKHVAGVGQGIGDKFRDLRNIEGLGEGGLLKWLLPGGESGAYEGSKMMLDPEWEQNMMIDMVPGTPTSGQMIKDPSHIPGFEDYIPDEEYYRNLGLGSRREADIAAGRLDISGYDPDKQSMKEYYTKMVEEGKMKPIGKDVGFDYQIPEAQMDIFRDPEEWATLSDTDREQWADDFRTWENKLRDITPQESYVPFQHDDKWIYGGQGTSSSGYTSYQDPVTGDTQPVYNPDTQEWEMRPIEEPPAWQFWR